MDWFIIAFRLIHIISAIVWVGGTALFFFYIEPAIHKLGPDAEKFVDEVVNKRRAPVYFAVASTLTVFGGIVLYYHDAGGLQVWAGPSGTVFTIGAVAGIIAWLIGATLVGPSVSAIAAVGSEIKAAGGPPTAELIAKMRAAQERSRMIGRTDIIFVGIAAVCMETARYFV
jgi:uncharacterized membrane protein